MSVPQANSSATIRLLIANLRQEMGRLKSTESLLNDLAQVQFDESTVRTRIETAQQLAAALQKDRDVLLQRLARESGLPAGEINLSAVMAVCPPPQQQELFQVRRELTLVAQRSRAVASSVSVLVHESLQMQQTVLSALMGITTSDRYNAYGAQPLDSCTTRMESRS